MLELLPVLNVLLIPMLGYIMRIERGLTKVEAVEKRVDKLEERVYAEKA